MRTLLHFGAHKTASTSLQQFLNQNKSGLRTLGSYYITPDEWLKSGAYDSLRKVRGGKDMTAERVVSIADFFKQRSLKNPAKVLIFSNEGVYGQHNLAKMGTLYPSHDVVNKLFAEGTQKADPVVVLFVRRQDTFLESTYLQSVHYGSVMSFYDYISGFDLSSLMWSPIAESLHARFGKDRVFVYPFEHIRKGFRVYLDLALRPVLGDVMDQVLATFDFEGLGSRNRSFSGLALQIAMASYPFLSGKEDKAALRTFLQTRFSNETHERANLISPQFRKFLLSHYQEDNKLLMRLCGEKDASIISHYVEP